MLFSSEGGPREGNFVVVADSFRFKRRTSMMYYEQVPVLAEAFASDSWNQAVGVPWNDVKNNVYSQILGIGFDINCRLDSANGTNDTIHSLTTYCVICASL